MTRTLHPPATRPRRGGPRRAGWLLLSAATPAVLAYMLSAYVPPDIRTSRVDVHGDQVRYWLLVGHIGFGAVATVTGLTQFWPWLRRKHPGAHRWTGRTYFFAGIFPAMILAVPVSLTSESGVSNIAALNTLLVVWAVTGVAGLRATRARRYGDHRKWMIRNYAATLAVLVSRLWAAPMALIVFSQQNSPAYQGNVDAMIHDIASSASWLAIVVNMVAAEIYVQREDSRRIRGRARAGAAVDR